MGLRTFNVKSAAGRRPASQAEELFNNNIDIGGVVSFPDGEYAPNSRGLYPRDNGLPTEYFPQETLGVEGQYKDETIGSISRLPGDPPRTRSRPDGVDLFDTVGEYPEDPKTGSGDKYRQGAALLKAVGGVINANAAHSNFVNENNMKMFQSQLQQNYIRADAARAMLREGTKGNERKGQALISAVAQGQSASGDLAQTAVSNEEVYAAQNAMNIEINAMRAIYGLQSEQISMESNNRLSKINRDATIAQSIIGGATSFAMAGG